RARHGQLRGGHVRAAVRRRAAPGDQPGGHRGGPRPGLTVLVPDPICPPRRDGHIGFFVCARLHLALAWLCTTSYMLYPCPRSSTPCLPVNASGSPSPAGSTPR